MSVVLSHSVYNNLLRQPLEMNTVKLLISPHSCLSTENEMALGVPEGSTKPGLSDGEDWSHWGWTVTIP